MKTLRGVMSQMVAEFGPGKDALAAAMGMSAAQFHNRRYELRNQHFDVDEFLAMQGIVGSTAFAEFIAEQSGGAFVPLPDVADVDNDDLLNRQLELAEEVGALARLMKDSIRDGSINAGERSALYDEANKLFRMAHELVGVAVLVYGE